MFPPSSIGTIPVGVTTTGDVVTMDAATLNNAIRDLGYMKKSEANDLVDGRLGQVAQTPRFVKPATWDPINVQDYTIPAPGYIKYEPPISKTRPKYISSEGKTLGGGMTNQAGLGVMDRVQSIRERIRGGFKPPTAPPIIPPDISGLDAAITSLDRRMDRLEEVKANLTDLDPLMDGILDSIDSLSSLSFAPTFGLAGVINRLDISTSTNSKAIASHAAILRRLVDRTDKLNLKVSEINESIQGILVILGQQLTVESITSIAEKVSKTVAVQVVNDALKDVFDGDIFGPNASDWFDRQLAARDLLTAGDIAGFSQIRQPFLKGSVVDPARATSLSDLLDNADSLISGTVKARESWDTLFTDAGIDGLRDKIGVPDLASIDNATLQKLMERAKALPPLNALTPFFRNAVSGRTDVSSADVSMTAALGRVADGMQAMRDNMAAGEYRWQSPTAYGVKFSTNKKWLTWPPDLSTGAPQYHTSLFTLASVGAAGVRAQANNANLEDAETRAAVRDFLEWVSGQWQQNAKDMTQGFQGSSLSDGGVTNFWRDHEFINAQGNIVPWDADWKNSFSKLDAALAVLPDKVPTGWGT